MLGEGFLQIFNFDELVESDIGKVEADAGGVEHGEGHGVDGLMGVGDGHVAEGVYVGAGVL